MLVISLWIDIMQVLNMFTLEKKKTVKQYLIDLLYASTEMYSIKHLWITRFEVCHIDFVYEPFQIDLNAYFCLK